MGSAHSDLSLPTATGGTRTSNFVSFYINGKLHEVDSRCGSLTPNTKLVDYIRNVAGLKGTKFMCTEGGCGACIVQVEYRDAASGSLNVKAVNSCLIPIFSVDGWKISTIESLGNRQTGYNKIQKQLVKFSGTQCGFCSPGMVMNMNALLESKKSVGANDIEDLLDGSICRCTGYRPIVEAFKSLSEEDSNDEFYQKCRISRYESFELPPEAFRQDEQMEILPKGTDLSSNIWLTFDSGEEWIVATTLTSIFEAIERFKVAGINWKFVAGNTGTGVFKNDGPYRGFIDIQKVPELGPITVDDEHGISVGSGATLFQTIEFLQQLSQDEKHKSSFIYASDMSQHLKRIANTPVRNVGTIGGNLMLKHKHPEFPSDVFVLLSTLNAVLTIASSSSESKQVNISDFLGLNMENQLIVSISLPVIDSSHHFRSFKISRRFQNSHADINAGFLFKLSQDGKFTVVEKPTIVYGGVSETFIRASSTESFLEGKSLKDVSVIQGAMKTLDEEIQPSFKPPDASIEYRKKLTQSLLYKVILRLLGSEVQEKYRNGGGSIERGPFSSKQTFDTDKSTWPLNQPIPKVEAVAQCSGEAEYINDIPPRVGELFGAFVLSTVGNVELESIDASAALKLKGVEAFIQAKDVPGENNYMVVQDNAEEIFVSKKILYAGQSLGLILADSRETALEAVKLVNVKYSSKVAGNVKLDAQTQLDSNVNSTIHVLDVVKGPEAPASSVSKEVKGEFKFGGQYHLHMETQICLCIPKEDGISVYSATQWMDHVQAAIAAALTIPNNQVSIEVRRIGGAYGAKISRASHIASACAVAAKVSNRPVRLALDLPTNMELIGKRSPYTAKYEVVIDDSGKIQSLKASIFAEVGAVINDADIDDAVKYMQNCYDVTGWTITPAQVNTDKAPNTYCRAPGTSQGIAIIENIMEHLAFELKMDAIELRKKNFIQNGSALLVPLSNEMRTFSGENVILQMLESLSKSADVEFRQKIASKFNTANRWRKRGISILPLRYTLGYPGVRYPVYVGIYKQDGTVVVNHGGVEVGQGINTKVIQTVAFMFGIPVEKVRVTPSNNVIGINADLTGGSITSELCCYAASRACQTLIDRMKPVRDRLKNPTWEQVVTASANENINLSATHMYNPTDPVTSYDIWGLVVTEVEIDVLTGEYKIVRVDILEDAGRSLNPDVDIGQVEGAFVMSIGWWTTENLVYDSNTGKLLTNGTWEYKVPLASDIPSDFRVTLLQNAPNPYGVLRSKATGEPPLCLGVSVLFALRNAIFSARSDAGNIDYVSMDGPMTQERIVLHSLTDSSQFLL